MAAERILGVGVVGLGIGEQHARAYAADPRCRVLALFDLDGSRAETLARDIPGASVAPSLEAILMRPDIDVVSIASFDDDHFAQIVAALGSGKHVFAEKPLCRTWEELRTIKHLWLASGGRLRLRSNLVLRASPLFRWLKEAIAAGGLGPLYSFHGEYLYGRVEKITEGWRARVRDYSVMEGGGVHIVDLLLWLTGERPVRVTAAGNRIATAHTSFRYNDFVAATFEFPSGLIAQVNANFGCVHRHQHVVRVFGTKATFLYDDAGARLHESRDPEQPSRRLEQPPLPAHKGDLIPDFVTSVLSESDDDTAMTQSFFDGVAACIAADRAVASGLPETIDYV